MEDSILQSIKELLMVSKEDNAFDSMLVIYINDAIMQLRQIGVGDSVFNITGADETWSDYLGEEYLSRMSSVKSYIYFKVRLAFDPPSNSFVIESIERQLDEIIFRLNLNVEGGLTNVQD